MNIWRTSTRCLKADERAGWARIPSLRIADGSLGKRNSEQAEHLFDNMFPGIARKHRGRRRHTAEDSSCGASCDPFHSSNNEV